MDAEGMTLYYFTEDESGVSNATEAQIIVWPVFYVEEVRVPDELDADNFGAIARADGGFQTTYMDWPLYYYVEDVEPGDTMGHGVNDSWFVVNPEDFPPSE